MPGGVGGRAVRLLPILIGQRQIAQESIMGRAMVFVLVLLVSSCATIGKEVTQDQLLGFKAGETTINDVVAKYLSQNKLYNPRCHDILLAWRKN